MPDVHRLVHLHPHSEIAQIAGLTPIWSLKLADVLGVGLADLLNVNGKRMVTAQRSGKPPGKLRKVFEDISRLPRRQQEHIIKVVSALVMQYEQSRQ
jgi:hypothetical protein